MQPIIFFYPRVQAYCRHKKQALFVLLFAVIASILWSLPTLAETLYLHKGSSELTANLIEPPSLISQVKAGTLPAIAERIPTLPHIVDPAKLNRQPGLHGGSLRMSMTRAKDTRQMVVYGYARLAVFNESFELEPDILLKIEVQEGRRFKLLLRPGHKWSDGRAFTSEDFRYWWEDIANNKELYPSGPPKRLLVDNKPPKVSFPSAYQVNYEWEKPNPEFLPALANAAALYIYAPSHYLKQFHVKYQKTEKLNQYVKEHRQKNWASMHNTLHKAYNNQNHNLPSLQPWLLTPSEGFTRFTFKRNPWFHRLDSNGRQLPYLDEWVFSIFDSKLIGLKAGTGELDLQGRYLTFKDIALLKSSELEFPIKVNLWKNGKGAHLALMPNLNAQDPVWRKLLREKDFRKALSLGINRHELNRVIYFGLATEGQNTLLPESPLYVEQYRTKWTDFDINAANKLLDDLGLTQRNANGYRILSDGRPLELLIEIAGSGTEKTDVLSLIKSSWADIGVGLFIKPVSTEVLRRRIFAGLTLMTLSAGAENGLASADSPPSDFVPVNQVQYQWPKWGQYYQTNGDAGEPVDMEEAQLLMEHYTSWLNASNNDQKRKAWRNILSINSENIFTIGIIAGTIQPIVHLNNLNNVPTQAIWNWNPGAHFGSYRPDLFWFSNERATP